MDGGGCFFDCKIVGDDDTLDSLYISPLYRHKQSINKFLLYRSRILNNNLKLQHKLQPMVLNIQSNGNRKAVSECSWNLFGYRKRN